MKKKHLLNINNNTVTKHVHFDPDRKLDLFKN